MHAPGRSLLGWSVTAALCATVALLGWEALHGGIQSHHVLADPSLPAISNAWGLVSVPALAGLAAYTVSRRARGSARALRDALWLWGGALMVGLALAVAFTAGYGVASNAIALGALAVGLVVRTYRPEAGFGFTLGMMAAAGPVLPLIMVLVAAAISALVHLILVPSVVGLWRLARRRARGT